MRDKPPLQDLSEQSPLPKSPRFCVTGECDAAEWEDALQSLTPEDWPEFDLIKAPTEDRIEIYLLALDEEDARTQVESIAFDLVLGPLEDLEVHPAAVGPELGL